MRICDKCIHDKVCLLSKSRANCELFDEKRPHGEWIPQDKFSAYYKCSNCGIMIDNDFLIWRNFCPNCGAKMSANDRQVTGKLNSEIENGWRLKEGNVKEAEAKKCPNCGSDLYEHCYMCCYEGEKVMRNE